MVPPRSLSYQHPFLVASLADNTIISYLVTSSEDKLEISTGRRLWGHTSAVSGAEVNNRGRAVSISSRGDEIRVWELEDAMTTASQRRTSTRIKAVDALSSVTAAITRRGSGLGLAVHEMERELSLTRTWVGFDDEQVVVLGERDQRQIMALYDFT
jgi:WD40 repeat protein